MSLLDDHRRYLERRGLTPASIDKRLGTLAILEREVGPLLELTTDQIERFLDTRAGRAGAASITARTRMSWLSHVHRFYAWAIENELADRDPTMRLVRPKLRRRLPRPLPEPAYQRARELAPNATMHAWLLLGGHAGLRSMEIAGLRGDDVDLDARTIRVLGKGDKERVVPMHPRIAELAATWPTTGPVFVSVTGDPFTPARVSQAIGRHLRRIGINATAHQLRHRFATALLEETGDIALVADVLGHESLENTRIYAQVAHARKSAAVGRLA